MLTDILQSPDLLRHPFIWQIRASSAYEAGTSMSVYPNLGEALRTLLFSSPVFTEYSMRGNVDFVQWPMCPRPMSEPIHLKLGNLGGVVQVEIRIYA